MPRGKSKYLSRGVKRETVNSQKKQLFKSIVIWPGVRMRRIVALRLSRAVELDVS